LKGKDEIQIKKAIPLKNYHIGLPMK